MMTAAEAHEFTVRGGPWDGEVRVFPTVSWGCTSVSWPCEMTHDEHTGALSSFASADFHTHTYLFGADHPDDLIHSSTRYHTEGLREKLEILEPIAA